jgi:uncharacterized protein (DUF433 family)
MPDEVRSLDRFRASKAYPIWQAAKLAGVTTQTAAKWLQGYEGAHGPIDPVFGESRGRRSLESPVLMLSFLDLVELVIVGRFRKRQPPLRLERIRDAHRFARETWGIPYPFASLKLLQMGGHLLHVFDEEHPGRPSEAMALDMNGQPTLPGLVKAELTDNLDFPDEFAGRWYPRGRQTPIVVDPHIAAGRPTVNGTGITVATVQARWASGESIRSLARDYGVSVDTLDQILKVADIAA